MNNVGILLSLDAHTNIESNPKPLKKNKAQDNSIYAIIINIRWNTYSVTFYAHLYKIQTYDQGYTKDLLHRIKSYNKYINRSDTIGLSYKTILLCTLL